MGLGPEYTSPIMPGNGMSTYPRPFLWPIIIGRSSVPGEGPLGPGFNRIFG
jgi:hypothetical protein